MMNLSNMHFVKILLGSLITIIALLSIWKEFYPMQKKNDLKVRIQAEPSNTDPLAFDSSQHHQCFRSVLGSLTDDYKRGGVIGMLASNWQAENGGKVWHFHLNPEILWENGEKITAQHVVSSFTRAAYIFRKNNSSHQWIELLEGYEKIESPNSRIDGLEAREDEVILRFKRPPTRLLENLSFGNYAIAHPNDYNHSTGEWKDKKKITAAGPYRIKEWSNDHLILELRSNYPRNLLYEMPFSIVNIDWVHSDPIDNYDVITGVSTDFYKSMTFNGPAPAGIAFFRCLTWQQEDSPCGTRERRETLRSLIYEGMKRKGFEVPKTFFPPAFFPNNTNQNSFSSPPASNLRANVFASVKKMRLRNWKGGFYFHDIVAQELPSIAQLIGVNFENLTTTFDEFIRCIDPGYKECKVDFAMVGTNISIENPTDDIRYMFLSKEGIQLPDSTGKIRELIKNDTFSIQEIDKELYSQAIVFPIGHYSRGIWTSKHANISDLNIIQPPIDFRWIGKF